jgi:hypothetical protein
VTAQPDAPIRTAAAKSAAKAVWRMVMTIPVKVDAGRAGKVVMDPITEGR